MGPGAIVGSGPSAHAAAEVGALVVCVWVRAAVTGTVTSAPPCQWLDSAVRVPAASGPRGKVGSESNLLPGSSLARDRLTRLRLRVTGNWQAEAHWHARRDE